MDNDQRNHLITLFDKGMRLDGRKPLEYREPIVIQRGFTKTAEGSSKVTLGETEVLVGVKMEVGAPYPDSPGEGTIMVGAELLPLSNPQFELGPPGIQAIELARIVDRGIRESKALDFKKLCIRQGELVWIVSIDVCSLNDAGNLFDVSALGALAALQDAVLPKLDGDKVNYKDKTKTHLAIESLPISVTVCKIGNHLFVDPTTDEEEFIDARLTVASLENGDLCALQKGGDTPLAAEEIQQMIGIGIEQGKKLRRLLLEKK